MAETRRKPWHEMSRLQKTLCVVVGVTVGFASAWAIHHFLGGWALALASWLWLIGWRVWLARRERRAEAGPQS